MGLRITTWNVNGIRNPFQYQPWRDRRTFAAMFDILEADIVVFQETKIQRKDLRDDMVLVPGWDCYFSLPRHKKGYSGVVIYTRQSVCAPIKAEEGITGTLSLPNSSTKFCELPEEQQIGGYPFASQLEDQGLDFAALDSEGRCVILEFPAFVLIGVYSPANRDESRDDFRIGFLNLLDARVRNLLAMGKRVFLTGDLNISREELDTANAEASMRKSNTTQLEYYSTPARRLFNQLLHGGRVFGERDEGREKPVLLDICRAFHPTREGMFTCWEQKVNARPGNFGARIDYVLCSLDMKDWFCDSNIQEGLIGSDHCPVYAVLKDKIILDGKVTDVRDAINPYGMFVDGQRKREYSMKDMLSLSGKLLPEFDRRQNIRDMFTRKPSLSNAQSTNITETKALEAVEIAQAEFIHDRAPDKSQSTEPPRATVHPPVLMAPELGPSLGDTPSPSAVSTGNKRALSEASSARSLKRVKSNSSAPLSISSAKGQQSLKGFFKPKPAALNRDAVAKEASTTTSVDVKATLLPAVRLVERAQAVASEQTAPASTSKDNILSPSSNSRSTDASPLSVQGGSSRDKDVHDPIESKESWSKLFTKPAAPRCEGHNEPCISLLTKKSGINCGRSFWMCPRPLGPTGAKEKNTQWRCQTFIWCSDWNPGLA